VTASPGDPIVATHGLTDGGQAEPSDAIILFGPTGDLARKKLFPALYDLALAGRLNVPIVGVASSDWTLEQLCERVRTSLDEEVEGPIDPSALGAIVDRLCYVSGDYGGADTFDRVATALDGAAAPLAYLAIPPSLFGIVVGGLERIGANRRGRVVVEKPFGRDQASAQQLNATLAASYADHQIFRIDHFLGKEPTLDLLVFRMANAMFHPAWDRHHVASVQITMAESFGMEGRGRFYEEVGAIRDVVQNHLLQVLALIAMEPPIDTSARELANEKMKVMRALRTIEPSDVVRGQFVGYRSEDGVAPDSEVETYVALRAWVDSWRWAGVPFYIRAGKSMAVTATEVVVEFQNPAKVFYADAQSLRPHSNHLRFRMKPGEGVSLLVSVKGPGQSIVSQAVDMRYEYDSGRDGPHQEAYARLLGDALQGDQTLFARAESVEEAWRVVDESVANPTPVLAYQPGTWGPETPEDASPDQWDAVMNTTPDGGWHRPLLPGEPGHHQ
jgi:glucose-6-phosphate 1-dehydrogenase